MKLKGKMNHSKTVVMMLHFITKSKSFLIFKYHSILLFIIFSKINDLSYIFLAESEKDSLHSFLENNLKSSQFDPIRPISSYHMGLHKWKRYLSCNSLHNRKPGANNVFLDSKFYSYLTNLYSRSQFFDSKFIVSELIENQTAISFILAFIHMEGFFMNCELEFSLSIILKAHIWSSKQLINGILPVIPTYVNENWRKMIENCLCFDTLSRPNYNEVFSELGASNYYADEMSRESIEEFKKIFSNSSDVKLDYSNKVSEISLEIEEQQDEVSSILIKLKEGAQAGDNASQFILTVAQFERLFGPSDYDECYKYSMQYILKNNHNYEIWGNMLKR